jgi:hypothetical protein
MRSWHLLFFVTALAAVLAAGCSSDSKSGGQDTHQPEATEIAEAAQEAEIWPEEWDALGDAEAVAETEATAETETAADTAPDPDALPDVAPDVEPESSDAQGEVADFGFDVRVPGVHHVECPDGPMGSVSLDQADMDWLCTFEGDHQSGHVYVQSNATGCQVFMGPVPLFTSPGAWISMFGQVSKLTGAGYDWGGNHHNDSLEFNHGGRHYRYYHSSFGYGWRACQDMDCAQVYGADGVTLIEDGCTPERTRPIVCKPIKADGSYDPLVDQFAKCPGDPNR